MMNVFSVDIPQPLDQVRRERDDLFSLLCEYEKSVQNNPMYERTVILFSYADPVYVYTVDIGQMYRTIRQQTKTPLCDKSYGHVQNALDIGRALGEQSVGTVKKVFGIVATLIATASTAKYLIGEAGQNAVIAASQIGNVYANFSQTNALVSSFAGMLSTNVIIAGAVIISAFAAYQAWKYVRSSRMNTQEAMQGIRYDTATAFLNSKRAEFEALRERMDANLAGALSSRLTENVDVEGWVSTICASYFPRNREAGDFAKRINVMSLMLQVFNNPIRSIPETRTVKLMRYLLLDGVADSAHKSAEILNRTMRYFHPTSENNDRDLIWQQHFRQFRVEPTILEKFFPIKWCKWNTPCLQPEVPLFQKRFNKFLRLAATGNLVNIQLSDLDDEARWLAIKTDLSPIPRPTYPQLPADCDDIWSEFGSTRARPIMPNSVLTIEQ
jgi:hypothetical protein